MWRRVRDLNPWSIRSLVFETSAFGHSANSPWRKVGDSNPWRLSPRRFSRPVHSATLPTFQTLQEDLPVLRVNQRRRTAPHTSEADTFRPVQGGPLPGGEYRIRTCVTREDPLISSQVRLATPPTLQGHPLYMIPMLSATHLETPSGPAVGWMETDRKRLTHDHVQRVQTGDGRVRQS